MDLAWTANCGTAQLLWRERGGPSPGEPKRAGFGTRLLDTALSSQGGRAERRFETEGMICEIEFPTSRRREPGLAQWTAFQLNGVGALSRVGERVLSDQSTTNLGVAPFLKGGGEMGALIRAYDWEHSPIGSAQTWPGSLKAAVGILLNSGYPMYVAWGDNFTQLYNDAYRPILGSTKHPEALGSGSAQTFAEIWDYIGPMFRSVMATGEACTFVISSCRSIGTATPRSAISSFPTVRC